LGRLALGFTTRIRGSAAGVLFVLFPARSLLVNVPRIESLGGHDHFRRNGLNQIGPIARNTRRTLWVDFNFRAAVSALIGHDSDCADRGLDRCSAFLPP